MNFNENDIEELDLCNVDQCPTCGIVLISGSSPNCRDPYGCGEDVTIDEPEEAEFLNEDEEDDPLLDELDFGD